MDTISYKPNHSIRACACHPAEPYLISCGGDDGTVLLWDLRINCVGGGGPIKKFIGHKDSILCCEFGTLRLTSNNKVIYKDSTVSSLYSSPLSSASGTSIPTPIAPNQRN